eukprot:7678338-Karenia_brevis.AAC.1
MYVAPRVVRVGRAHAMPICPTTSIIPGCGQANHCARIILYDVLEHVHRVAPMVRLGQFVDDVDARCEGTTRINKQQIATAAVVLARGAEEKGLPVSGKSILLATDLKAATE